MKNFNEIYQKLVYKNVSSKGDKIIAMNSSGDQSLFLFLHLTSFNVISQTN